MNQLPEALQPLSAYKQFILWVPVSNPDGSVSKKPINYQTGTYHDPHDPAIWLDAATAIAFQRKFTFTCGIGFVFTKFDPFWFIDIDKCLVNGQWSEIATTLCQQLSGCAVEISQSGTGLHIFGTGEVPEHGCKNKEHGLELYTDKRFVALTGYSAMGNAATPAPAGVMNWLVSRYFPPGSTSPDGVDWTTEPDPNWNGPEDDDQLLEKMLKSKQGASAVFGKGCSISDLWTANQSALAMAYPHADKPFDHSSADAALCSHLAFWTGKNCERIDRLFRKSALVRDKWIQREDYRIRTIGHAVKGCKAVYSAGPDVSKDVAPQDTKNNKPKFVSGRQFVNADQQTVLFKGCVYVQHEHRVFVPGGQLLKPEQFKATFGGYIFNMDDGNEKTTTNAWEAFTESQVIRFPKVNNLCFRPDLPSGEIIHEEDRTLVNSYVPISTEIAEGDPTPFLDLVHKLLPDDRDRDILLSYISAIVQYPGKKFQWMPVLQGVQGNGKTFISTFVSHSIGHRYTHVVAPNDIGNTFNAWIQNKLFIVANEIYVNDKKDVINALKPLITDEKIPITPKGVDQKTGENYANFFGTMNPKNGVRKTRDDRRFCVFITPQQHKDDLKSCGMSGDYFPDLVRWAKQQQGYAIVNNFLRHYKINDEFNPATHCVNAPDNSTTEEAVSASLGMIEQEIIEMIGQGSAGLCFPWISSMSLDRNLDEKRIRLSRNKIKEILEDLGYIPHPALPDGRTNVLIPMDGGKPRLYIKKDHPDASLVIPNDIIRNFLQSQGITNITHGINPLLTNPST